MPAYAHTPLPCIMQVKKEITEIIDYLKDPALLRSRGVARIGGVLLAGAPGTGGRVGALHTDLACRFEWQSILCAC